MRHCDAVFAPPQPRNSTPCPCVSIHCATMPLLRHAMPQHCRAKPKAETRLSLPAQLTAKPPHCRAKLRHRGSVPSIAIASHCYAATRFCDSVPCHRIAKPRPCVASPCHRTALLCHRVAPNAAQFLAIALQVRATQRLCQAWQSLLCRRCTKRSYAVALRRGLHIAEALRRTPRIAAALVCIAFAWPSMLYLAAAIT